MLIPAGCRSCNLRSFESEKTEWEKLANRVWKLWKLWKLWKGWSAFGSEMCEKERRKDERCRRKNGPNRSFVAKNIKTNMDDEEYHFDPLYKTLKSKRKQIGESQLAIQKH